MEYIKIIKEDPYKLGFVDEDSPKEWESLIDYKLSEYKEHAYVDSIIKIGNIVVILELKPQGNDLDSPEYIKKEKELFKKYYKRILEDIESSEFYDLCIK